MVGQLAFVEGDLEQCPRPAAVEQRVRSILGMNSAATLEERATLLRDGDTLKIIVTRPDGSVLGERVLNAAASCDDLETLASVVLASWISDVHPEFVAALPPAPSRAEMPAETGEEPSEVAPPALPPAAPSPPAPAMLSQPSLEQPSFERPQSRRWELAAAAGASFSRTPVSALGSLGVRWMPERSGFGAVLAVHVTSPRTAALSLGSVRYWRWPLVAGPALRLPAGGGRLDLHAGLALAWLHAQGRDFEPSETRNVPRGGGLLGLRGLYGSARWRGFLEANAVAWGKTEVFVAREDQQPSISLPLLELYLTVGMAWAP